MGGRIAPDGKGSGEWVGNLASTFQGSLAVEVVGGLLAGARHGRSRFLAGRARATEMLFDTAIHRFEAVGMNMIEGRKLGARTQVYPSHAREAHRLNSAEIGVFESVGDIESDPDCRLGHTAGVFLFELLAVHQAKIDRRQSSSEGLLDFCV